MSKRARTVPVAVLLAALVGYGLVAWSAWDLMGRDLWEWFMS